MRSSSLRLVVLAASMTLTACATSTPPVIVQQKPLPAALAVPCPTPGTLTENHADAALIALKEMYDLYGRCGGQLVELINYLGGVNDVSR